MRRLVSALAVALLLSPVIALAQENEGSSERALLLILDASGSMGRVDADGARLIDGAKQALLDLVESLPDDVHVGLRVYGHRYPNTDRANGCRDTELIVPIGPLDRAVMGGAIASFDSKGFTPIGLSLEEAAGDFPTDAATKAIVLVSDGEDTCAPPDPCDIARALFEQGIFVRIETVGLVLDDAGARDQLQCIADATGGGYHEIDTIDVLARQLGTIADEALSGPEGGFSPGLLLGGPTREEATAFPTDFAEEIPIGDEAGSFRPIQLRPGQAVWYSFELKELQALLLDVLEVEVPGVSTLPGYLDLAIFAADGNEVGGDTEEPRRAPAEIRHVGATMMEPPGGGTPVLSGGTYYVRIWWDAPAAEIVATAGFVVTIMQVPDSARLRIARGASRDGDVPTDDTATRPVQDVTTTLRAQDVITTLPLPEATTTSAPEAASATQPGTGELDTDRDNRSGLSPLVVVALGLLVAGGFGGLFWVRRRR